MLMLMFFLNWEIWICVILFMIMNKGVFMEEEYTSWLKMSDLNFWMLILVLILYLMMTSVSISYKMSLNLLFILLFNLMWVSSFLVFFFMYEMVFVVIMFVIMLLGYSYERLMALYLMMFYSFLFSSPSLMLMLNLNSSFMCKNWMMSSMLLNYFLVGSFMVKFPIFGFHYWLPIAHVEASTLGSMLLAGVLLKLGSVGLLYVVMYMKFMVKFHWMSVSVVLLMLMILFMSDLKMMIAYSSIAHMSLMFYVLMIGSYVGKKGSVMMMLYHGYISPLMFWMVGVLVWWKTRSLMVIKFMVFSYVFLMIIFFLMILNMSFPPFMGFLSEVLLFKSLMINKFILFLVILSVLLSCYYNIYLFWSFMVGVNWTFKLAYSMIEVYMFMGLSLMLNLL